MPQPLDYQHARPPDAPAPPSPEELRRRKIQQSLVIGLMGLGVLILGILPPAEDAGLEGRVWPEFGWIRWLLLGALIALAFIPAVHRTVFPLLERVRTVEPETRRRIAVGFAIVAGLYFIWTAHRQDRDFFPKTHDEQSYLLQMRMLAQGKLWMPAHELSDFFETFHVIVEPVYASVYFPGTALMYFPGLLLEGIGWPVWLLPVIVSAACVGLLYSIVTELVDGLAGALAALALASLSWFRMLSILLMGQVPALLLGLLMFWGFLRWLEAREWGTAAVPESEAAAPPAGRGRAGLVQWIWMAVIGAMAGWMAITRPVDAVGYALPVGVGILIELYRRRDPAPRWALALALLVIAAAPFLAIQAVFNKNVTGSYTHTPFEHYINLYQPQTSFGFHDFDPTIRPEGDLPQKHALYDLFVVPRAKDHRPSQLLRTWADKYARFTLDVTLPARPLLILVPVGLLALVGLRRRVLWATLPIFVGLYAMYTFYLEHYIVVVAPAMLLTVVLALHALERAWPHRRPLVATAVTAGIAFVCIGSLPELNRTVGDETFRSSMLRLIRTELPYAIEGTAVVLVRFEPGATLSRNYHLEPVYNTEAAWPDHNRIVFAHDLAPTEVPKSPAWWKANRRIFDYYAQHQPDRQFILFNRALVDLQTANALEELGRAPEVAVRAQSEASQ